MSERLPWSVKGVEPEIRDDAVEAAVSAGMTLGQWLNGVIRDSLVDQRAAHHRRPASSPRAPSAGEMPAGAPIPPFGSPQHEVARSMPPFQQHAYAPQSYAPPQQAGYPAPPQQAGYPAPPQPAYAGPPYAHPYAPAPVYDPFAYAPMPPRGYDPVEARLSHYARMTQQAPAQEERVLSVVDAAVGAMEKSVKESERKTTAALESLMAMMERVQIGLPTGAPPAPQPAAPKQEAAPVPVAPAPASEALSAQLAGLMDRLATLEAGIASRRTGPAEQPRTSEDRLVHARRIESEIGHALDALGEPSGAPATGGVRPPPGRGAPARARVSVLRGGGAAAIADIAARQRALETDAAPKALLSAETQALEAIRRSIAALADQVRETREDHERQPDLDLRNELKDLQKSVQDLAPRRIVASINESLRALAGKIEQSRHDGVRDSQLAPIEKLLTDMRVTLEQVREPKGIETINGAIAQIARRMEDLGARSIDARQIDDIHQQFSEIRAMIGAVQAQSPAATVEYQIARLAEKLDTLAERPDDTRAVAVVATSVEELRRQIERIDPERMLSVVDRRIAGLAGLESRIEDLAGRIEATQAASQTHETFDTLADRIDRLTSRMDRPAAPVPAVDLSDLTQRIERRMSGIDALGARIETLATRLDRPAAPAAPADISDLTQRIERRMAGIDQLGARIDTLAARIDSAPAGNSGKAELDALTGRIGELQHTLERKVPTQPDVKGLEMILRKLADRIEAVRAPAGDSRSLDALQTQIMALAEKLDRAGPAAPGLSGLEKTIGELCRVVGTIKDTAVSAAQEAVRSASLEASPGMGMDPLAAEGMLLIKRDLTEMKSAQAQAENRARETMQSVSTLLERVATRLGTLESELSSPRAAALANVPAMTELPPVGAPQVSGGRPAPQLARPIAPPEAPAVARHAPSSAVHAGTMPTGPSDPALDLPLEPGFALGPSGTDTLSTEGAADPADPRSSFIAAARRAAQSAAAQSAGIVADLEKGSASRKAVKAITGLKLDGLKTILAERRKPLLLGLAALIFALGGLKLASNFLSSDEPVAPTAQIEETQKITRAPPPAPTLEAITRQPTASTPDASSRAGAPAVPDTSAVGSIGENRPPSAEAAGTTAPLPLPAAPAAVPAPARPLDVAELMKTSAFKGPDRLKQAALGGNLSAIYEIGARHADGRGVTRDLKTAAKWLELAASQGSAPAQYRFGSFHREGLGLQQDAKVAFSWFMKAAEQGHILAMHNLAVLYAEGVNGSPDYGAAAAWFRNAAEHGVKDSQFNIAILHVRGLGVAQDMVEAYKWFAVAAQQGDADAIKRRDEVAARLAPEKLADAKSRAEEFRARRPDMRANDVAAPEGGWDPAPRAPVPQQKKTRV